MTTACLGRRRAAHNRGIEPLRYFCSAPQRQFHENPNGRRSEVGYSLATRRRDRANFSRRQTPFGFISHVQESRAITTDGITRKLLVEPLAKPHSRKSCRAIQIASGRWQLPLRRGANVATCVPLFEKLTPEEAQALADAS